MSFYPLLLLYYRLLISFSYVICPILLFPLSLLEKDKLLFSFLLTIRIMGGKGEVDGAEWFFLLTGGVGMENKNPNPAPEWLSTKSWDEVCRLGEMPKYSTFRDDFVSHVDQWKEIYDSLSPQDDDMPGIFAGIGGLPQLAALRTIRPDKLVLAVQHFVAAQMGDKFVKPPPFDLQACYNDSSAMVPLGTYTYNNRHNYTP
jgi:dynein heavy chain